LKEDGKMVKQVRIISLGEIITPNIMNAIQAFTSLITGKKETGNPSEIGKAIGIVLQQNVNLINNFKLGKLDESDFTQQMIDALRKATGVELTISEFDHSWNEMNPQFNQFGALLAQATEYNSQPNQQIIFISFTNPKDIRNLIKELESNQQHYQVANDQLVEICGIQLYTTYTMQQNKAELIESTIKKLNTKMPYQSNLVNSISNVLSIEQARASEPLNIKYIRCVNDIKDPILKEDTNQTNQKVEKTAEAFFVDTIIWNKWEQSLSDMLNNQQVVSRQMTASKL